ncbi:MAG: hypothetical protein MI717_03435, partial [Spirochaetales bacterium]|nr:hypothetical protein [Spirochaetales bacterium]
CRQQQATPIMERKTKLMGANWDCKAARRPPLQQPTVRKALFGWQNPQRRENTPVLPGGRKAAAGASAHNLGLEEW